MARREKGKIYQRSNSQGRGADQQYTVSKDIPSQTFFWVTLRTPAGMSRFGCNTWSNISTQMLPESMNERGTFGDTSPVLGPGERAWDTHQAPQGKAQPWRPRSHLVRLRRHCGVREGRSRRLGGNRLAPP